MSPPTFLQREPQEGQPATERTEMRGLYDDENLYVGLIVYDSDPNAIIATELRRDAIGHQFNGDFVRAPLPPAVGTFGLRRSRYVPEPARPRPGRELDGLPAGDATRS